MGEAHPGGMFPRVAEKKIGTILLLTLEGPPAGPSVPESRKRCPVHYCPTVAEFPKNGDQASLWEGLLGTEKGQRTFATPTARHARQDVRKRLMESAQKGRAANYSTGGMHLPTKATVEQFRGEQGRPLEDVSRAIESRGHQA